jgi:hypothetical protein
MEVVREFLNSPMIALPEPFASSRILVEIASSKSVPLIPLLFH